LGSRLCEGTGLEGQRCCRPQIIQHEKFRGALARWPKFFYFDDNAGRRAVTGRMTREAAFAVAQTFLANL